MCAINLSPVFLTLTDPTTVFVPRHTNTGKVAFEMACHPGQFIIFDNMTTVRVGTPSDGNELFEQLSPFTNVVAYKSMAVEGQDCYIAFNRFGHPYNEELCVVDTSHRGTLIRYVEAFEEAECEETNLLRSMKREL